MSNPERQESQVLQAMKVVKKFSWDTIAKEYEVLFHKLISERRY
jgi:glycogen synthase